MPVAGQDADLVGVQRFVTGTQTMTVYKSIKMLTQEMVKLAVAVEKGEKVSVEQKVNNGEIEVPSVLLTPIAINERNLDSTVISDGFHSLIEVYQVTSK